MDNAYRLYYLPIFEQDLAAARDYIAHDLQSPDAALRLVEDTEKAILKRLANPLAFKPYHSRKDRKHLYYRINIRKFAVFYVVIGDVMEVCRFV
jgi:plasmid stabilization system protein ParE